ncbi:MAG TPA: magnesium transporter [Gemmatimonadales bacterium]
MMNTNDSAVLTTDELDAAWSILTPDERIEALLALDEPSAKGFFELLDAVDQAEILQRLPQHQRARFLALLPPDDLADVFQELDERAQRVVFKSLTPEAMGEVRELAAYDVDDAGGVMTPDFAHILPDMTVDQAIVSLRLQLKEHPETLRYVYVLEKTGRLAGVVSFRQLFGAPAIGRVRELMETDTVFVHPETDQEEVAHLMREQGIAAIPVLDSQRRMKGIITNDDVLAIMEEEATEDIHKLAAVSPTDTDYVRASVALLWKKRVRWLVILLSAGVVTSFVMRRFEATLQKSILLAFYLPLLMGAGGNTGTQSAMLVIRSLATGDLNTRNWTRVLVREMAVGFLLAITLAFLFGFLGYVSPHGGAQIAVVLALSMTAAVVWANLIGAVLPVAIRAVKLDPAVVSAPLIATLVDISGIVIYLSIAGWIL